MKNFRSAILGIIILSIFASACETDTVGPGPPGLDKKLEKKLDDHGGGNAFLFPRPFDLEAIPQDPRNPISQEKVTLGSLLFHEPALGNKPKLQIGVFTYSCASCHHVDAGFQANLAQGVGEGGEGFGIAGERRKRNSSYPVDSIDVQPVRTPSVLGIAYQKIVLWNGALGATGDNLGTESIWPTNTPVEKNFLGYEGPETQAIAGLDVHRLSVSRNWAKEYNYETLFDQAFPDVPNESRYSNEMAGLAIAAYERTIFPNNSGWQKWLSGDKDAMTGRQKEGAILFFGKAKCASCHRGPSLSDGKFHGFGMNDIEGTSPNNPANLGRGGFTGNPDDMHKFKTPQLYNLKDSPFYGHGASFNSISEIIAYHLIGNPENPNVDYRQLADYFVSPPIKLKDKDLIAIVDFIENALYDVSLDRYVPPAVNSGMCFPVNDPTSQRDLDCR